MGDQKWPAFCLLPETGPLLAVAEAAAAAAAKNSRERWGAQMNWLHGCLVNITMSGFWPREEKKTKWACFPEGRGSGVGWGWGKG